MEYCQRPHCGGWIKEIVSPDNGIEKICAKCSRSPNSNYERRIEQDKLNHIHLDVLFKAMYREKTRVYRAQKKLITKEERV